MSETSPVVTGISVTFTATPDSGYSFVKWVDANDVSTTVSTENPYTTTINADTALKAIFEADTPVNYTVSATAGTGGTASVSPSGSAASGTSVTFTATPDSGYSFVKWVDANNESTEISTVNPYTATITADTALKAIFEADAPVSTTWPQEEFAIVNSAKNSNLHYFAGSDSNTRVDNDFLNSTGSAQVSVALPFVIDDLSADVTYTVKIYAQGQGNPYAIVWDSSDGEVKAEELTNPNWDALKSTPTTFTFKGSNFSAKGTYYAGIKANEYINFYKIEVTKSAPIGDKAEAVGPHKSGSVSLSGTTLTATPTNSRDFRFVGWYDNDECTGNALSTESTYTYNGTKVYAKFDYVAYNMPIIDIVTHDGNGNPHASFDAAWAGKSKSTKYKNSDIVIANTNYTLAETKVQIGGRGNSTWSLDKKPFQLKFGAPVNLFNKGTAPSKTWILLANHADRSLLRNQLALDFARSALTGIPFSSSTTPVEVYINGEYQGVYLVVEKSEVDTGRVNITTVSENTSNIDEIGFLAEWDKLAEDNNHVPQEDYYVKVTGIGGNSGYQLFTIKDGVPEGEKTEGADRPSDATAPGGSNSNDTAIAISTYLNDVSNTIMTGTQEQVAAKVDMNSLVDMFILQELTKNCDVGGSSFYVSKNAGAGSKLTFQPPWDFDRGFGNDQRGTNAGKLYINGSDDGDNANQNQWFQHLYKETDWFKPLVVARWNALRNNAATDPRTMLANSADSFASGYAASANRNFEKWQVLSASTGIYGEVSAPGSYSGAISGLQSWITDRLDYLDIEWQYEDSSIQTLTVNYDATDYSYETGEFDYNDGGTKNAKVIPFVVNDTTHDITVTMNFTGSSKWVNVFTPSGATLTGFSGSESNGYTFGEETADKKYYVQTDGSFTFKIPAGSPTGTYYAAVTYPESYTSVTAKFTDDQAVTPYGSAAGEFSVSATSSDQAMGSASVNKSTADSGETATFTATANSGYMFVNWTDNNNNGAVVSTANPYSATVTGNMSLQANFTAIPDTTVEVETNNNAYGYVINYANNETVTSVSLSSNVTLKAKNRDGYLFVNWTVMEEDGSNKQSLGTRSKIKISDIASTLGSYTSPILMANFGAKTAVRFEAENFTDFISETKYQGQSLRDYDDPTAVLQGNTGYTAVSGSTTDPYSYDTTNENTFGDGHKAGPASGSSTRIAGGTNYTSQRTFRGLDLSGYASVTVTVGSIFKDYDNKYYKVSVKNNSTGVTSVVEEGDTTSTVNVDISNYCDSDCDVIVDVNNERWIEVEGTTASAGLGKIENWDNKSYSDLNVASTYSNGAAAALTGPSNGLAIPFTINEDLDDDIEVELGYNYGTLSEWYTNGDQSWGTGGLFVNLYTYADYDTVEDLILEQSGWAQSGNATPEAASDFLKSQGELTGNAFYYKLSVGTRDEVQTTTITLPAGLPAGKYMLSVATDENNYYYDEKYGNDYVDSVGTAFYDYIQFYTASTPDQPSPLTVGANFIFTDKWGNDLMTNAISKSTYSEGNILFHPSAPRYLVAQGYNIVGWTISELVEGSYQPLSGYTFTYGGTTYTTDSNGYVSLRANGEAAYDWTTEKGNIDSGCLAINEASFSAGSTIKFKAEYEVAVDPKTVTITNGKIYRKSSSGDTQFRSLLADGTKTVKSTQVPNFGEIRLEPSFEQNDAEFAYWTLNGMIYSFDADIHFSAWTNADFTARMADGTETRAVAFIDNAARTSGFETDDTSYHKITYDCAFYVPSGSTYVSAGLVYSNDKAAVKAATVSVSDSGAVSATTTTGKVLTTTVKSNLLLGGPDSNILNRQVMISISGMKKSQGTAASGKSIYRSAMAYLVYRDGSGYHVVTSPNVVTAEAAVNPNSSSENR